MGVSHGKLAASLVALASSIGCRDAPRVEKEPPAVKVAVVDRVAGGAGTRYSAHIEPATRVDMAFKVGGYIDWIARTTGVDGKPRLLQEGDEVREGEELASIRKTDYLQRLDEARAAYDQAKATAEQAQRDADRAANLVKSGSVGESELETLQAKVATATASVAGAKARVDEAATSVADTTLRSPMRGIVLKRAIEVGALAQPGLVAFTIADVSSAKAIFAVPDVVLPRVQLGAVQTVTAEAFPGAAFEGRISRISPSADPRSRVFEAEVTIPNHDGRLKTGMIAALSVAALPDGHAAASPPLVPLSSIVRAPGKAQAFAVFVVDALAGTSTAHLREVELGDYLGRVIPVKKGLAGGETIVVLGAGLLSDGEAVEIVP